MMDAVINELRHELRTPINHIVGYSELLHEEAAERGAEQILPDLQKIQVAGKRLLALVIDFVDASSVDAGRPNPELIGHELRIALDAVIGYSKLLQEEATEQGVPDFVPELMKINAAGKHLLGMITAVLDLAGNDNRASVEPLGPSASTNSNDTLSQPVAAAAQNAALAVDPAMVLVVDDNEANRDLLSRRLVRDGHTVAVASHGRQALEMLAARPFDLILLDIMMPEMNGYEVLRHLKSSDALRHIPVIVLSSIDEGDSVVTCIELGAEDYLPKPFDSVLLRARIGACLEKKRLRDREVLHLRQIEAEQQRSDQLLHVIFPPEIVLELKAHDAVQPRRYENVAVLFADVVGFTAYCDGHEPQEVIPGLQRLVVEYEQLALRYELQKIKTTGDDFMATAGLLTAVDTPVLNCVRCGEDMIAAAQRLPERWNVRIGIHVGPVVAGVLGRRRYLFDLWGDTVNTAKRLESLGSPGSIILSGPAWEQIADHCRGQSLGGVQVKGKGTLEAFQFGGFETV